MMKLKICFRQHKTIYSRPSWINCFYLGILWIILTSVTANSGSSKDFSKKMQDKFSSNELEKGEAVPPEEVVECVLTAVLQIRHYVDLQMKLEKIGQKLYNDPENQRDEKFRKISDSKLVQNIISECKEFHKPIDCTDTLYRTADGTCNNLNHPEWGKSISLQDRFLPAAYEGIYEFRKSADGQDLPAPRNITLKMVDKDRPAKSVSNMFTYFGQMVTHDITLTPVISWDERNYCCYTSEDLNNICAPIYFGSDDPFYSQYGVSCQTFLRSSPYPKCNFEKRGVVNAKTSFLDCSHVYGNSETESQSLRTLDGSGRLKTQDSMFGELMPKNHISDLEFCPKNETENCFLGGDERVNQHTVLTGLQTIFVLFHNLIADSLLEVNPRWDDEQIYQEARRIVIAIYQIIIYRDYLPQLIGSENMENFDLFLDFYAGSQYNDQVNPAALTEFTTAAGRLHSMIYKKISKRFPKFRFDDSYSNVRPIHEGKMGPLLAGSCEVASQENDIFQAEDITNYLYKAPGATYGIDLPSVDIQRGRDLGLPPYVDVVKKCSNSRVIIRDFPELNQLMTADRVEFLRSIYKDVRDIDLVIGLLTERTLVDAVVGPTTSCILSHQFYRSKFGDSFFVSHTNKRYLFTPEQIESFETYTLARIICQTTKVKKIRKFPFLLPGSNNPLVLCESFPSPDLNPWKE